MDQKILLRIVRIWAINKNPEYRGFRCANCQKNIRKAWHYYLLTGGYRTPVHFCNECKLKFEPSKTKGLYKTFTCDKCGKKMYKAYHVWTKKTKVLSETHFCKECGDKLGFDKKIKGIIYDLDGTIISTVKLHEDAWIYAGKKFDIPISQKMLLNQRGMLDEDASLMMLPKNKRYLLEKFVKAKIKYVMENLSQTVLFPHVSKVINQLLRNDCKVWICTSTSKSFTKKVLDNFGTLKQIKDNIVWREMYKKGKPSPDALNLTIKKMGLTNSQVYYIGDALRDYKTSINSKVKLIYFCSDIKERDLRIPKSIPIISSHKEIFKLLK